MLKKKIWANFQRIVEVFTKKIFKMLSNIWVWDPGSEIRDPEKTYSESRVQKGTDPGSGSATLISPVLQIHDILVWIRIRGSMPLDNGSEFGSGSY
jgi:hypothetical protein